jgi:hypothetical protein
VKRWGKSPPRRWQQRWHGNPQSEQGQISGEVRPAPIMDEAGACVVRIQAAGRLLEATGDGRPRQMTIWRSSGLSRPPSKQNSAYGPTCAGVPAGDVIHHAARG